MALKVTKPKEYSYIPVSERGEEKPFTLTLKRLTSSQMALIQDKAMEIKADDKEQSISLLTGTQTRLVCKLGIVGWENVYDEDGKEVKAVIAGQGLTDKSMDIIPQDMLQEINNVILGITNDPDNADLYLLKFDEEGDDAKPKPKTRTRKKS